MKRYFSVLIILLKINFSVLVGTSNLAHIYQVECQPNVEWITNHLCSLKIVNATVSELNMDTNFSKPVLKPFIHIELNKRSLGDYEPFFINITQDLCAYKDSKKLSTYYFKAYLKRMEKYSNIKALCPLPDNLYIRNYRPKPGSIFNSIAPAGYYKVQLDLHNEFPGERIFTLIVFYVVKE